MAKDLSLVSDVSSKDTVGTYRDARRAVIEAIRDLEEVRPLEHDAPRWRGLDPAQWQLVEQVDIGGARYVVARRHDAHDSLDDLTTREAQVLALGALGHTTKMIAFELGVADSTVRVLFARARAKLGVRTRSELIESFLRKRG